MRRFLPLLLSISLLFAAEIFPLQHTAAQRHKGSGKGQTKKGNSHAPSADEARAAAARQEQIRKHLEDVRKHMHDVRVKIKTVKRQEAQITETIDVVQGRIDTTRATLKRINRRLTDLSNRHVQAVARLSRTQDHLAQRRRLLAGRLRENYERRRTTYAEVLIQSQSVHQLLSRGYYVQ